MSIHNRSGQNGQAGDAGEISASAAQGFIKLGRAFCPREDPIGVRIVALQTRSLFALALVFPIGSFGRSGLVLPSTLV
jgi:hypothetical protein